MAITYGFYNAIKQSDGTYDRTYNSDQISNMFEGLVSGGVFESVGDALIVTAGTDMTIQIGSGRAVSNDGKWLKNDAPHSITLAPAHVMLNRWSAIVVRFDSGARTVEIVEKPGADASTPTKPEIEDSMTVKEICLAYIYVGAGVGRITQANITDTRANSEICGWVTGLIKQVDTSQLFLQWQTAYEEFYAQMQAWQTAQKQAFDEWYVALTEQLQVNTKIVKYHKVVDIGSENGIFPLDMEGYTYDENDILLINVNGVMLTEVHDYILDTSKTPVEIHTNATLEANNLLEITVLKSVIGY